MRADVRDKRVGERFEELLVGGEFERNDQRREEIQRVLQSEGAG